MRNIRINEAESIFEVMWNGGGERYSFLSAWNLAGETACEKITSAWTGAEIIMMPGAENKPFPFQMEREGELDISEYDRLVMMATISGKIKFRMSCEIDGVQQDVMLSVGNGERNEFSVPIAGNLLTKVHLEFENLSRDKEVIRIVWLGLADSVKLKKMLSRKSPYTAEWPGCFKEIPEFKPQLGLYFGEEELYVMRQKVQSGHIKKPWMICALEQRDI